MDDNTLHGPLYGLPDPHDFSLDHTASIQAARAAIDARRAALQFDIPALGALRNSTLPINQLPNEVFVEILFMARMDEIYGALHYEPEGEPREIGTAHVVALMRVCRHWWAVVRSTPRLWRAIDVYRNLDWMYLCISRASGATLEFSFHDGPTVIDAIFTLDTLTDRIRRLLLPAVVEDELQLILSLLDRRMPNIEELGVVHLFDEIEDPGTLNPRFNLSFDMFPRLTALHLDGVVIPWTSAILSRFTFLEVKDVSTDLPPPSLAAFLVALKSCTQLEELRLSRFLCEDMEPMSLVPNTVFTLPKLRKIVLVDYPGDVFTSILSSLHISTRTDCIICPIVDWHTGVQSISFRSLFPANRSQYPILTSATYARVSITEDDMCLDGKLPYPSRGSLAVQFESLEPIPFAQYFGSGLADLTVLFAGSPLDYLDLSGNTDHVTREVWEHLFATFPKLETLDCDCCGHSLARLFSALAIAPPTAEDGQSVVCPNLREISIRGSPWCTDQDMDEIVRCLRLRASRGAATLRALRFHMKHENRSAFLTRKTFATLMFAEHLPDGVGIYDLASESSFAQL